MEHPGLFHRLDVDACLAERHHEVPDAVPEHLVTTGAHERGREPGTVGFGVDRRNTAIARLHAVQVRRHRDVPRQDVVRRIVGDRRVIEVQIDLGREQQQRSRRRSPTLVEQSHERRRESTATRIARHDQMCGVDPTIEQGFVHIGGVVHPGREGELRRQAVVGDEDLALGPLDHRRSKCRVHHRRGADVPTAVQVQDRAVDRVLGAVVVDVRIRTGPLATPQAGYARDGVAGELDLVHDVDERRHHGLADVVEHPLHRAELLDRQTHGEAHERTDHLTGDGPPHVVEQVTGSFPRATERHPGQSVGQGLRQAHQRDRCHRQRCGLHLGTICHHHGAQAIGRRVECDTMPAQRGAATALPVGLVSDSPSWAAVDATEHRSPDRAGSCGPSG